MILLSPGPPRTSLADYVVGVIRDRTASGELRPGQHLREAELAARTAERDRLWNLSQDMLARANYEGKILAVSPAWAVVLGWSESELLSRPYGSFMHPQDRPATLEAVTRFDLSERAAG